MNIRVATAADAAAILALVPRLAEAGTPRGRDAGQIEARDLEAVRRAVQSHATDERLLVAEQDQSIVGFVHVTTVTDYYTASCIGHVSDLVVAAQAEGQGIGRALIEAGEQWARSRGYRLMQLNVLVQNTAARGLYERLGYAAEWLKYVKPLASDQQEGMS